MILYAWLILGTLTQSGLCLHALTSCCRWCGTVPRSHSVLVPRSRRSCGARPLRRRVRLVGAGAGPARARGPPRQRGRGGRGRRQVRGLRPPQVGVAGAVRVAQVAGPGAITGGVTLWRVGLLQVLQLGVLGEVRVHPLQYRGVRPLARPRPQLREAAEAGAGRGGDAGQVQGGVGAAGGGGRSGAAAVAVDVETAGGGAGAKPAPGAGPGGLAAQAVELVRDGGGQGEVVQVTQQQPCIEDGKSIIR